MPWKALLPILLIKGLVILPVATEQPALFALSIAVIISIAIYLIRGD